MRLSGCKVRQLTFSLIVCESVAVLSLAAGTMWIGHAILGGIAILVGILWLTLSLTRKWVHAPKLAWLYMASAAVGTLILMPDLWMLLCVIAALCAWDLGELMHRFSRAGNVGQEATLIRRHLLRLASLALAGSALGVAAISAHISLPFGIAVALAVLATALLASAARRAAIS